MHGYKRCCRWDLNHQPPPVFPSWSVFFPFYGRKYSMKLKLFMENMWEFFLVFYFVPYKVNIPMHAGELFYVYFLFHTKLIFPCMQGELNKSYIRNMFVGYKWKFTFQTKPLWGFATVRHQRDEAHGGSTYSIWGWKKEKRIKQKRKSKNRER